MTADSNRSPVALSASAAFSAQFAERSFILGMQHTPGRQHDRDVSEAISDRLLGRGTHFEMRGRSYHTRLLKETDGAPPASA